MNDISIDLIALLKEYMTHMSFESDDFTKQFHEGVLYIKDFNEFLFCTILGDEREFTRKNTPAYIYKLLDKPNLERTLKYFKEHYQFYDDSGMLEITKKDQFPRTIHIMITFLNLATYLYKAVRQHGTEEELSKILDILIISAVEAYNSLYSSRDKNCFGYYFEHFLTTSAYETIEPYDRDKHRQKYSQRVKQMREKIDTELDETVCGDKISEIFCLSHIYIVYGQRKDKKLPKIGLSYYITIGKYKKTEEGNKPDGNPTFFTEFNKKG